MLTLKVVVHTIHSLKVVEFMAGLRFTGGDLTRKDGRDTFRFEGDEQTLREAQRRLEAVPLAICVRQEIVEDEDAPSAQVGSRRPS